MNRNIVILVIVCFVVGVLAYLYLPSLQQEENLPESTVEYLSVESTDPFPVEEIEIVAGGLSASQRVESVLVAEKALESVAVRQQQGASSSEPALSGDEYITQTVEWFRDPATPLLKRREMVLALAGKGDADSVRILKALGDASIYLNRYAVEALGGIKGDDIAVYLKGKLSNDDVLIVCAAVRALGRMNGKNSIDDLIATVEGNRSRPDGHEDMLANAVVTMMGAIGSRNALPFLAGELGHSEGKGWNLEYGSLLLKSIDRLGGGEGREAAGQYADRLEERIPEDPLAGQYFRDKIVEARKIAEG